MKGELMWSKYYYVCYNCDSSIEIQTTYWDLEIYCICNKSDLHLITVEDIVLSDNPDLLANYNIGEK
jgi:hypothetical protein